MIWALKTLFACCSKTNQMKENNESSRCWPKFLIVRRAAEICRGSSANLIDQDQFGRHLWERSSGGLQQRKLLLRPSRIKQRKHDCDAIRTSNAIDRVLWVDGVGPVFLWRISSAGRTFYRKIKPGFSLSLDGNKWPAVNLNNTLTAAEKEKVPR